jgi:hypothetical protein
MIVVELVKALANGMIVVKGEPVHQIFQQCPDGGTGEHQGQAVHACQSEEHRNSKRHGDEVAKMPDAPHQSGGQACNVTQHCKISAPASAAFIDPKIPVGADSHDENAVRPG